MMNLILLFLPSDRMKALYALEAWPRILQVRRAVVLAWLVILAALATVTWLDGPFYMFAYVLVLGAASLYPLGLYALGGAKDMTWEDPALTFVRWWWGPSDATWLAALDGALDAEFPHWREMERSSPDEAVRFALNKARLVRVWPSLKPDYAADLGMAALKALRHTENKAGSGGLEVMVSYRDWQLMQDRQDMLVA